MSDSFSKFSKLTRTAIVYKLYFNAKKFNNKGRDYRLFPHYYSKVERSKNFIILHGVYRYFLVEYENQFHT